jgi:hypothetical protein
MLGSAQLKHAKTLNEAQMQQFAARGTLKIKEMAEP